MTSAFWAAAFAGIGAGEVWARFGWLAGLGVFISASVAWNSREFLEVRGRRWVGAVLFGLGHVPALGAAHLYVWTTAAPAYPLLLLYLALFPSLAVYFAARVHTRWPKLPSAAVFPVIWVAMEIVRGEWLLGGYPWYLLGHSLTPNEGLSWVAPVFGAYGCSLLLALVMSAALDGLRLLQQHRKTPIPAVVVAFAVLVPACILLSTPAQPPPTYRAFRVSVIQTNLPQDNKLGWAIADRVAAERRWLMLTQQAAAKSPYPELLVWPETMFPGFALNPEAVEAQHRAGLSYGGKPGEAPLAASWFADALIETQNRIEIPFLVGAIAADGLRYETGDANSVKTLLNARTNSAILVTDGRVESQRYDKVDLMAFGEYIPLAWRWPAVQRWLTGLGAQGMAFDLAFGKGRPLFNIAGVRTGTPICFEVCHQSSCREFATGSDGKRRADLLINLTNDGWFYESDFNRRMHLLQARWRCAELATPMVRAANTGISCVISATGEVAPQALDNGEPLCRAEGAVTVEARIVKPDTPSTFFATTGHLIIPVVALTGGLLTVLAFWPVKARIDRTDAA